MGTSPNNRAYGKGSGCWRCSNQATCYIAGLGRTYRMLTTHRLYMQGEHACCPSSNLSLLKRAYSLVGQLGTSTNERQKGRSSVPGLPKIFTFRRGTGRDYLYRMSSFAAHWIVRKVIFPVWMSFNRRICWNLDTINTRICRARIDSRHDDAAAILPFCKTT